jgi:ATP-dependent Zn protease
MSSNEKNEPTQDLKDKLRSLFVPQDPRKQDALPPKTHFSIWYFLAAFLLFTYLQQSYFSRKVETIPYGQFKQALAEGNVSNLTIGPDNITGTLKEKDKKPDQQFITIRVDDPSLVKELDKRKLDYRPTFTLTVHDEEKDYS